ncbi:ankyrin repeat and SOCS box protein 4 [Neoarius graeffei]|uniref:ankyrin repeat and SOCS box protein 4 n=1 Tax=Neoarius graeffei TaxID=443677 RepID=UPI00298C1425|nr:ankyrin repeat and SOCS box protein 4 [Neoarius graeffei]
MKPRFLSALQHNDAAEVDEILRTTNIDIDTVFDVEDRNRVLASYKQGYWLPDYKLESSWAMGLHICMMHNAVESALVLLQRGAAVNRKPNGKTPLHVACEVSHADCVGLLLNWGAKVNGVSLSGHTPLHYCVTQESVDCARQLIIKGADVNKPSQNNDEETPLHVAARLGIPELVGLYAAQGADVNVLNARMETPLITAAFWAMDAREQTYSEQHHLVCRMLLDYGANPNLQEESKKTALHQASWNCDEALMQILLDAGADPKIMDMNGCAALQYVLNMMQMRPYCVPYRCFQLLLNNGAARVYPKLFHKVLQICHDDPNSVEVMANSYEHLMRTSKWSNAIPDTTYKSHRKFYDSLFAACTSPRSLQHLARCAIRIAMHCCCQLSTKRLPVPPSIKRYILLDPVGIIY